MSSNNKIIGIEASGINVLKRAVDFDNNRRYTEALVCYQEGIELLMTVLKATTDEKKKAAFRKNITDYMDRAEKIKSHVEAEKEAGQYHEQIHILENSTGYSYKKVFGRFLDEHLTFVKVEDPYIRNVRQIYNFLRFCEMLVKSPCPVEQIFLTTGDDEQSSIEQKKKLEMLQKSLQEYGIKLTVEFSNTLHDREIRFNNGWIIKIGRGLDYFKQTNGNFAIGFCDHDLRKCYETTVDIFHSKFTKVSSSS